jgi:hypothetical protein
MRFSIEYAELLNIWFKLLPKFTLTTLFLILLGLESLSGILTITLFMFGLPLLGTGVLYGIERFNYSDFR